MKIGAFEGRIVEIADGCVFIETDVGDVSVPGQPLQRRAVRQDQEGAVSSREELVAAYLRLHPESAARLIESMPVEQANAVLNAVDVATAAPVVGHMLPTCAAQCMERQPPADAALVLERLGSRESVAVLRHLPAELRESRAELARPAMAHGVQAAA